MLLVGWVWIYVVCFLCTLSGSYPSKKNVSDVENHHERVLARICLVIFFEPRLSQLGLEVLSISNYIQEI